MVRVVLNKGTQVLKSGVYVIEHVQSHRRYVGSATWIESRWSVHKWALRKGVHYNKYLQRVWDKYGEKSFKFRVLERCAVETLSEREQHYIDVTPHKLRLNLQPFARTCHTLETRARMSEAAVKTSASVEERLRRSERAKRQHLEGNLGRKTYNVKIRTCISCLSKYTPNRTPVGTLSQSKYCLKCRPKVHKGGNYKYTRALLGEGRPKQLYKARRSL